MVKGKRWSFPFIFLLRSTSSSIVVTWILGCVHLLKEVIRANRYSQRVRHKAFLRVHRSLHNAGCSIMHPLQDEASRDTFRVAGKAYFSINGHSFSLERTLSLFHTDVARNNKPSASFAFLVWKTDKNLNGFYFSRKIKELLRDVAFASPINNL